jgi:putative membrane protein
MENERNIKRFIWTMAVVIPAAVALLFLIPPVENLSDEVKASLYLLPKLNAYFNGTAFLCLIGAFIAIKNKNIKVHRAFTTTALVLSMLFLVSYVAFHLTTESTKFGGEGWIRTVYFIILISHILLSYLASFLWSFSRMSEDWECKWKNIAKSQRSPGPFGCT